MAIKNGVMLAFLLAGAAFILLPFFWMISLSLKPADEIFAPGINFFPSRLEWQNYVKAFEAVPLLRFLMNGVIVTGAILFFQILLAVPCAYALAHRRFLGRTAIFRLVVAGLLIPYHVTAIPVFLGLAELGLLNTYKALVIPFVALVFGIFLGADPDNYLIPTSIKRDSIGDSQAAKSLNQ
jgi:multiple sugar transport system permease protein